MLLDVDKMPMETRENVLNFVKEIESCNEEVAKTEEYIEIKGKKVPLMRSDEILSFVKEADAINKMFNQKS